jgi:pimeloyl-ACP methyl ester carboxylesterase
MTRLTSGIVSVIVAASVTGTVSAGISAEDEVLAMLAEPKPYHPVSPELFERLGWELPDDGATVKALADAAPGGALDPRELEKIPADRLGYTASWHEVRYQVYGVDWDIPGLHLVPLNADRGLPTLVIINGGAANWYEFFLDPLNRPGLGQYLAQRVPVLLVSIPGNYRHGGWSEDQFDKRIPGYLLDRDVSEDEAALRNAVYTFRVVSDGVEAIIENVVDGPAVIIGHSTGGEVQFILKESGLEKKLGGLSMGWGTGGPAGMRTMREFRGVRHASDYLHVSRIRARTPDQYSHGYLGPLNPFWDVDEPRQKMAEAWMSREQRRRAQFKQPLQDMEHSSTDYLKGHIEKQIRQTLQGNTLGIDADEVIDDLFTTMESPLSGYRKMIWTTALLDTGHWNEDLSQARELLIADEFRQHNPAIPIRVLLFAVPMTHYGHIEKPRQLAGGLVAALRWLATP